MDQLSSIGVTFENGIIDKIFTENVLYYFNDRPKALLAYETPKDEDRWTEWAVPSVYDDHRPVRPWGLGEIVQPDTGIYRLAGKTSRTPGMYRRINPDTAEPTHQYLKRTNESIHRSVRIRLALEGLGYDDVGLYKCRALLKKGPWELERMRVISERVVEEDREGFERIKEYEETRWGWVYCGPQEDSPPETILMEEPLGPYEQKLLHMSKGTSTAISNMEEMCGEMLCDIEANQICYNQEEDTINRLLPKLVFDKGL